MRIYLVLLGLMFSDCLHAENCITDLWKHHLDNRGQEIEDFSDLDEDGVPEKIVFVSGGASDGLRYSVRYLKKKNGCFHELYAGTEGVDLGKPPEPFKGNQSMRNNIFNGFKPLSDSESISILSVYLYDKERLRYRVAYTVTEEAWVSSQNP